LAEQSNFRTKGGGLTSVNRPLRIMTGPEWEFALPPKILLGNQSVFYASHLMD